MRQTLAFSLLLMLLSGCGKGDDSARRRVASLDELAVTIRDHPRSYFYSDRRGAFLIGSAGRGAEARHDWSVNGQMLLQDLGLLMINGKPLDQAAIDSVRVTPLEVVRFFRDGTEETLTLLDQVLGEGAAHALVMQVQRSSPVDITVVLHPGAEFVSVPQREPGSMLFKKGTGGSCACYAGAQGEISPDGITVKQVSKAQFVIVYTPGDSADYLAQRTHGEVDLLRLSRRDRMEKLLQQAYLRTSDYDLTRALRWLQLSLDGLIVESSGTAAAATLPWDGSVNIRDNAIALAGLDAATGNYSTTAGILRTIAQHQDSSADGGAWFARELYEYVIASGDTGLARDLYPTVRERLAKALDQQTDAYNLFLDKHASPRGTREADLQALWYFQQTIGSIFASFLGDSVHAAQWALQADLTSSAFNRMFVDTTRNVVYDRIDPNGRGSMDVRPGALLCLDVIESEAVRQNTVKNIVRALLRPDGIAMSTMPEDAVNRNGAIQNWMAGQMVYALTRYDCQHISYPITRRLAARILTTDMVGVLPAMYEATGSGNEEARALGAQASLAAMAEFVRSFYQDYLGAHINMTTRSLALEPKLPDDLNSADFTLFAGDHPLSVRYDRKAEGDRVVLRGDGFQDSLRVTFLWMMKNEDAWRGAVALPPGITTTLLFGERDATAFCGEKETPLVGLRHLKGFSQRKEFVTENGELRTEN